MGAFLLINASQKLKKCPFQQKPFQNPKNLKSVTKNLEIFP